MLTADLVRARRKKGELSVAPLSGKTRARALELSETYLAIARDHIGQSRGALRHAWAAVPVGGREKKLADGLLKLIEDACDLAQDSPCDPIELRREVFGRAAQLRREGGGWGSRVGDGAGSVVDGGGGGGGVGSVVDGGGGGGGVAGGGSGVDGGGGGGGVAGGGSGVDGGGGDVGGVGSVVDGVGGGVVDRGFDREAILGAVGARFGMDAEGVERALYSDLKSAHTLLSVEDLTAAALVERYDRSQIQAVLLRAVRVRADVRCRSPFAYRAIFRALKFRRLLHRIEAKGRGYRIEIDGPYSLFDSVTKYGLQLAWVLPALMEADELDLSADVRWGKRRDKLTFSLSHRATRRKGGPRGGAADGGTGPRGGGAADGGIGGRRGSAADEDDALATLPDEVRSLVDAFAQSGSRWEVAAAADILDLPGVGLCVPDLVFSHERHGRVYFEALGFWSREAVWKRVELVQAGLPEKILFAVSSRLRVSEEVLDDVEHAALYVYKGTLSARAVARHLEAIAGERKDRRRR